ncbi:hypothetical protein KVR01_004308 [Diaporthe batatas]|uniref:uncharacterized protein n=1 Tax=Diaporthe batatas TaxID=748121 RepID=UPI001D03D2D1|nr:uncharacterized protein KVR01_004308 [Diaporthe batatas]KAG8165756.1 hypothetical protein KVR01_004308 [Diaporthe batatas]
MAKLEAGSSPPPYEAAAYPKTQSARRLYRIFSFRAVVAVVALTLFLCLNSYLSLSSRPRLSSLDEKKFQAGLARCTAITTLPARCNPEDRKENPRWNTASGQDHTVVLRNATLFDGADFSEDPVDVTFTHGLITSISLSKDAAPAPAGAEEVHLHGAYVTPGLVDMHSHHLVEDWPQIQEIPDGNEMFGGFGPLTPFVRALDSMKAYDVATRLIASGGVTSSLIIPGSANIMGGEGAVVKNSLRSGANGEFVVEEMLLEHGLPAEGRRRYMKMACGENPIGVYKHTRMGNAWVLRKWLARAKELVDKQDGWCEAAGAAGAASASAAARAALLADKGGFPEELELDSTAGMLRGRVAMHNHCYEPQDFETMLRISHEFGFRVRAFHHAIAAWQVPEMLKEYGENLTIATFAEFALYKKEAYAASLSAGKILNDHGIPVAYKSDHSMEDLNSKYLLLQSAVGHSFGLPADKALQAVTSVPAASLEIDDRVGYVRTGYDADIVVWDSHPLSVGATPRQVFIDGVATLDPAGVEAGSARVAAAHPGADAHRGAGKPAMRATVALGERERLCAGAGDQGRGFVISGITTSFLDEFPGFAAASSSRQPARGGNLTMVIADGRVACLGAGADCSVAADTLRQAGDARVTSVRLENGHLSRGLVAVTSTLGMAEIAMAPTTGDGVVKAAASGAGHAKYGVSLGGGKTTSKNFARARLGGVTRAVQAPVSEGGLVVGVSTGMRTGQNSTLLNGGLFQEDVAMHVALGEDAKAGGGAVSVAVEKLRGLIRAGGKKGSKETEEGDDVEDPWVLVANGSLPLVVKADSTHDIQQVILLKRDFPNVNTVILGGHEAPLFAEEIARAKIPLIFTGTRPGPDSWTKKDSPPGPPLGRSPADILSEAGVFYAVAINTDGGPPGDSRIQSLALEASWTAKYAGLSDHEALRLVSSNVEEILGLERGGDVVVWEGNPLQFGTPVLAFQARGDDGGRLEVGSCWPSEADE